MPLTRRLSRRGFTLIEALMVITILGLMYLMVMPRITDSRSSTSLRAASQELRSAFAAARAAALQKGKVATLTLTSTTARVNVLSGLNGTDIIVYGPIRFDRELNSSLSSIASAPMTVSFDPRGLMTPIPVAAYKYKLTNGTKADTVCISTAGVILSRSCTL
ncbi:MAG TPA: type II secretion system protein [Gemmatimonas sp.]|nr:type II secretion system protein [Gemmatimonas sp.]